MNYLLSAIAASLMLLAVACQQDLKNEAPNIKQEANKEAEIPAPPNTDWDKKIIKTGTISIEVDDYKKYNTDIHQQLKKWQAYVGIEQENSSDYKIENSMNIKIPVQYFDDAMQQLSGQSCKLLIKQINAQDVTGEFLDTKARIEAKKRIRLRYLDMVQKAKNMEEVLQVEKEINAIQEQIEAGEGRINYLDHSATYSTIQLSFFQVLNAGAIDNEPGFGKRFLLAMNDGLTWMSNILIAMVTIWPLWLGVILGIWVIKKRMAINKLKPVRENQPAGH